MEFRPPSYFALAALIEEPLHGYAIMHRARALSRDTIRLSTGTLYRVLERAMAEGLVMGGKPYVVSGRERREYTLTPLGHSTLREDGERVRQAAGVVHSRLAAAAHGVRS